MSKKPTNKLIIESKDKSRTDVSKNKKVPEHSNDTTGSPQISHAVINSKEKEKGGRFVDNLDIIQSSGLLKAY
jgi:hypothetical protein